MRLGWPVPAEDALKDAAERNNEWAISGASGEILAEIADTLGIKPAQHWRISAKN